MVIWPRLRACIPNLEALINFTILVRDFMVNLIICSFFPTYVRIDKNIFENLAAFFFIYGPTYGSLGTKEPLMSQIKFLLPRDSAIKLYSFQEVKSVKLLTNDGCAQRRTMADKDES